jgi:ribosomal protein L3
MTTQISVILLPPDDRHVPFTFEIGRSYLTQEGEWVTVLGRTETRGYECLICSDNIHRYDRSTHSSDAGRCTGSPHDYSDPRNFMRPT